MGDMVLPFTLGSWSVSGRIGKSGIGIRGVYTTSRYNALGITWLARVEV
jgi:hypothetical protein